MKKNNWKKALAMMLAATMMSAALAGCSDGAKDNGSGASKDASPASKTATDSKDKPKEKVLLWYLWTGAEGETVDQVVKAYNEQSDKYIVESLSVPDMQKVMIAISSGSDGPDVTDDFSSNVASYATKGIIEPLDSYIDKSGYDRNDIVEAALKSCTWEGKTYALPISSNFSAMFYNKTLLKEAGYTEPPKTMEELLEVAIKATKVNADGTIDTMGFPMFPGNPVSDFNVAAGGGWLDGTTMNAGNPANIKGMSFVLDYRKEFGVDAVSAFQSSGKYLDPADPFIKGKQLFRFDGIWLATVIDKTIKADIDYGICQIPYPKDNPELAGRTLITSSVFYVPTSAKNKEGGFDFAAFIASEKGEAILCPGFGAIPTSKALIGNKDVMSQVSGADFFGSYVTNKNVVAGLSLPSSGEYDVIVNEEVELAMNLKKSPEDAIASIVSRSKDLFK